MWSIIVDWEFQLCSSFQLLWRMQELNCRRDAVFAYNKPVLQHQCSSGGFSSQTHILFTVLHYISFITSTHEIRSKTWQLEQWQEGKPGSNSALSPTPWTCVVVQYTHRMPQPCSHTALCLFHNISIFICPCVDKRIKSYTSRMASKSPACDWKWTTTNLTK